MYGFGLTFSSRPHCVRCYQEVSQPVAYTDFCLQKDLEGNNWKKRLTLTERMCAADETSYLGFSGVTLKVELHYIRIFLFFFQARRKMRF